VCVCVCVYIYIFVCVCKVVVVVVVIVVCLFACLFVVYGIRIAAKKDLPCLHAIGLGMKELTHYDCPLLHNGLGITRKTGLSAICRNFVNPLYGHFDNWLCQGARNASIVIGTESKQYILYEITHFL
jgi:hypothetical protein